MCTRMNIIVLIITRPPRRARGGRFPGRRSKKTLRVAFLHWHLAGLRRQPHRARLHAAGSKLQPALLPARSAHRSGGTRSSSSRRRGRRFPQALGAGPPGRDAAAAGQPQWRQLAHQAALRGKQVALLPPEAYGGYKDVNEAWAAGVLAVGAGPAVAGERPAELEVPEDLREMWEERTSIMVYDGHVPRAEAERLAWAGLASQGEAP